MLHSTYLCVRTVAVT